MLVTTEANPDVGLALEFWFWSWWHVLSLDRLGFQFPWNEERKSDECMYNMFSYSAISISVLDVQEPYGEVVCPGKKTAFNVHQKL